MVNWGRYDPEYSRCSLTLVDDNVRPVSLEVETLTLANTLVFVPLHLQDHGSGKDHPEFLPFVTAVP
jgi:hypothetical protein